MVAVDEPGPGHLPSGATDTHLHVYEPGYPLNPSVPSRAEPEAGLDAWRTEMAALGLSRAVIVQPSAYGTDNRCTLAAMAALGKAARGVAILPEDVPEAEVERLARAGMRGLRCLLDLPGGMMDWGRTARMAGRFAERGWHLDLQFPGRDLPGREAALRALPGLIVIDHLGKLGGALDPDGPAVAVLLRLLDTGRVWVKLSAPYHADRAGSRRRARAGPEPGLACAEALPVGQQLAASRAGSTARQPHPARAARRLGARSRNLVDNPAALYGFDPGG